MSNVSQKPLITTIIPTYRRPKLLRRAIKSVLNQTYPHFQVCVYDNASGDETASVVAEMAKADHRVKYHCHPENIGAHKNFVYGMEHVETPFFSFLSDDDLLLPEFYETALAGFEKYPDAIFSATATINMDNQGNVFDSPIFAWEAGFYQPPEGLLAMLKYYHPTWTGILFRREVIEKVGILDEESGASDLDFELRTAAHYPFVFSTEPGAIFSINPLSVSSLEDFHHPWPGWLKMIRNLTEDERIPSDVRIQAEHMLTERLKRNLFSIGTRCILRQNFEDASKSAEVLRNYYHIKTKAFFLYTTAKACKYFSPAYCFFVLINKLHKFYRLAKSRHLQEKFGHYARLLEM